MIRSMIPQSIRSELSALLSLSAWMDQRTSYLFGGAVHIHMLVRVQAISSTTGGISSEIIRIRIVVTCSFYFFSCVWSRMRSGLLTSLTGPSKVRIRSENTGLLTLSGVQKGSVARRRRVLSRILHLASLSSRISRCWRKQVFLGPLILLSRDVRTFQKSTRVRMIADDYYWQFRSYLKQENFEISRLLDQQFLSLLVAF